MTQNSKDRFKTSDAVREAAKSQTNAGDNFGAAEMEVVRIGEWVAVRNENGGASIIGKILKFQRFVGQNRTRASRIFIEEQLLLRDHANVQMLLSPSFELDPVTFKLTPCECDLYAYSSSYLYTINERLLRIEMLHVLPELFNYVNQE